MPRIIFAEAGIVMRGSLSRSERYEDPSKWGVVFETVLKDGSVVDGPTVVLVDDATGEVNLKRVF